MEDYKHLAIRYLKKNKQRTIVTILGSAMAVMFLYTMLNVAWSVLLNTRELIREKQDYEIVLFTENETQIQNIIADRHVKSAYVGPYYENDYYNPVSYENALYINTKSPYFIDKTFDYLQNTYGVKGVENYDLAYTYMQGDDYNEIFIAVIFTLLISYVFAIFGVGIVRNSIQLTMLEQVKDFGNMRCIGASKGELKAIIYLQGAIMEVAGIIVGVLVGTIVSIIIGLCYKIPHTGFHFLPVVPLVIAFLGDLYFAMDENAKLVTKMTPISAIRGEYRIKKEKLKARRKSLAGLIFGVEGDYAHKNLMRNPGRFIKTVASLAVGIAAIMAMFGVADSFVMIRKQDAARFGYYNIFFQASTEFLEEEIMANMPPVNLLEHVSNMSGMEQAKRIQSANLIMANPAQIYDKLSDEYVYHTIDGEHFRQVQEVLQDEDASAMGKMVFSQINCYAYDKDDMKHYRDALVDGTLELSENGIILVNGGTVYKMGEDDEACGVTETIYTNCQVGDTIDFVDMKAFRSRYEQENSPIKAAHEKNVKDIKKKYANVNFDEDMQAGNEMDKAISDLDLEYHKQRYELADTITKSLVQEGKVHTYTIEGIVNRDANFISSTPTIIIPDSQYAQLSGFSEDFTTGMRYHFKKFNFSEYEKILYEETNQDIYSDMNYYASDYIYSVEIVNSMKSFVITFLVIVIFVVGMSTFNIINTSASNIHMRRKELAQIRVLGVSRKGLYKIVLLEGVILSILASLFGILLGIVIGYSFITGVITLLYGYTYHFPVLAAILGVCATTAILCGSLYVPLKRLPVDVASDLATAGE